MKLKEKTDSIITGVLTRRVVLEEADGDSSVAGEGKVLVPKAINDGLIDHALLQDVKLIREVKEKFYTRMGDVIMKLSTPYDCCVIEREEDQGLIVPSFSVIIRGLEEPYTPHFLMAFLSSKYAWSQIEKSHSGKGIFIIRNDSIAELEIPEISEDEIREISGRYANYLKFRRLSSEIINLEKERNDAFFFSKGAGV